jgi:hypothetical protein
MYDLDEVDQPEDAKDEVPEFMKPDETWKDDESGEKEKETEKE